MTPPMNRRDALKRLAGFSAAAVALPGWMRAEGNPVTARPQPAVTFHNVAELEPLPEGGWRLNRVPATLLPSLNANAQRRAYAPAGVELRFNLRSGKARIWLRYVENRGAGARERPVLGEIHHGDQQARVFQVGPDWTEVVVSAAEHPEWLAQAPVRPPGRFDPQLVRVALPYMPDVQLLKIEGDVAPARPEQVPASRYLAYGSSITNGAFATRPGDLYTERIARALAVDHFNLGFGGGAHLEPEMAAWIAGRRDWDFATLEMGINLVSRISAAEFEARMNAFLPPIVQAHPNRWIFCIDLFTARGDLTGDTKYPAFREIVREAVRKTGAPQVVYCDGRQLLPRASGLTPDFTHPSDNGFEEIAQRLVEIMRPRLGQG
jgi:hypothetical protein